MNEPGGNLENLRVSIEAGRERFDKDQYLNLEYVRGVVVPKLQEVLEDVCFAIEQDPMIGNSGAMGTSFVVHYTSVATVVSLLQAWATWKKRVDLGVNQGAFQKGQGLSLRMYDSAHFNDPDEGNYFLRNLNLPEEHKWMKTNDVAHAYIASFIIPESNLAYASDNLVFWRTYGKEGEGCSLAVNVPPSKLQNVRYGSDAVARAGQLLLPILRTLQPIVTIDDSFITEVVRETLWGALGRIQFLFKSEAYAYEKESRVVATKSALDEDEIFFDYRDGENPSSRLRHYCEDEALAVGAIFPSGSSITIGPCVADKDDLRRSLEILKRRGGLLGPEVRPSVILYRKS